MHRSYRSIILAIFGWLLLAHSDQAAQVPSSNDKRAAEIGSPVLQQQSPPIKYTPKCDDPADGNEESVCASISQAKSAQLANAMSAAALVWNKGGIVAVILTLISTVVAAVYSARAANAAARAATTGDVALRDVQRAFVHAGTIIEHVIADKGGNVTGWEILVPWHNAGSTPALNCATYTNLLFIGRQRDPDSRYTYEGKLPLWWPFTYTPSSDRIESNQFFIAPQDIMKTGPTALPIDVLDAVFKDSGYLFIHSYITYDDIFGKSHETRFCIELANLSSDPKIASTKPASIYRHWKRYNTVDDQCAREDKQIYENMPAEYLEQLLAEGWKPKGKAL